MNKMKDGRIDLHTHILPGVDDGAQSIDDALELAQMAVDSGVRTVVATPHSGRAPRFADEVEGRVRALQYRLRCEGIPLRVLPGMEIMTDEDTPDRLAEGSLLPLCGTRYALVEFSFQEDPLFIHTMLKAIRAVRFVPIVAHPERYECLIEDLSLAAEWRRGGALLQVNKGSLFGRFGEGVQRTAMKLLLEGQAAVVASDAHSPVGRTTEMHTVRKFLTEVLSPEAEQALLRDTPARLLADEELTK